MEIASSRVANEARREGIEERRREDTEAGGSRSEAAIDAGVDAAVSAAVVRGDVRHALTLLMDRYGDRVYRFAYAMAGSIELAEEVRQRVFVEAYRDLSACTGRSVRSWLFGIARHRALDLARNQRRWNRRYKNDAVAELDVVTFDLDRDLDRERLVALLSQCLSALAPAAREAVVLRYQQELSYDEAAALTGALPGTLQQRVARALPVLRSCIEAVLARGEVS